MDPAADVISVLQLLVNLGPPALYFLILGLVNSQRQPRLVSMRADFVTLAVVFLPVLLWPAVFLMTHHWWWLVAAEVGVVAAAFAMLLPGRRSGWVLYHQTTDEAKGLLRQAVADMHLDATWEERAAILPDAGLHIRLSSFPWLGSVSIRVDAQGPQDASAIIERLGERIDRRCQTRALLPSPVGTCLVAVGIALWILPLWMTLRHMDAIVDLVQSILFA